MTKIKTSEAVWLAAIPIAGTAAAYLFEMGICSYHGIPASLITMTPSRIIIASFVCLAAAWVIHFYIGVCLAFLHRRKGLLFGYLGLGMIYAAFPFALIVIGGHSRGGWMFFVLMFCLPFAVGLIPAVRSKNGTSTFLQRWLKESIVWGRDANADKKPDKVDVFFETPQTVFTIVSFVAVAFFAIGNRYANNAVPKKALGADPSMALVAVYGDYWIFRPISSFKGMHAGRDSELLILSGEKVDELKLYPLSGRGGALNVLHEGPSKIVSISDDDVQLNVSPNRGNK